MILLGFNVVVARNGEPTLRPFGVARERIGPKGGFTAIGIGPIIVAVSRHMPNGQRWTKPRAVKLEAYEAMQDVLDDWFAFEAAVKTGDEE